MTDFYPVSQDRCDGCGRNRNGYYTRRKEHMATAYRSGVPLLTIAQGYGMGQEWALKLIQEQLGQEAVREVQIMHRVGWLPDCEMCGDPVADDEAREYVNDRPVHHDCLMSDEDVFTDAIIEDRLLSR